MTDDEFPRDHPEGEDVETFDVDAEWSREQFVLASAGLAYLAQVAANHGDLSRIELAAYTQVRLLWDNPDLARHLLTETEHKQIGAEDADWLLEHLGLEESDLATADDEDDREAVEIEIEDEDDV
jgi:hypothetical protein